MLVFVTDSLAVSGAEDWSLHAISNVITKKQKAEEIHRIMNNIRFKSDILR
jgi:fatty acid-binding protein DegV